MSSTYHLSLGFNFAQTSPPATATLQWGVVNFTDPQNPSVVTGSNNPSNWSVDGGDEVQIYVYDLENSGATPSLTSNWIEMTEETPSDMDAFTANFPVGAALAPMGNLHSYYFSSIAGTSVIVPTFMVAASATATTPLTATVQGGIPEGAPQGVFGAILQIQASLGGKTTTFTTSDPEMIVVPGT